LILWVRLVRDDGHLEFEAKLKRYVHLELLLKVLTYDRNHMDDLKFADVYRQMLDKIMDEIMKEMAELRRYFRKSPGRIIEKKKEYGDYAVSYTYRGYQFEVKYLKEFIRVECREILKEYLRRCLRHQS
jgi:hypothetical protein